MCPVAAPSHGVIDTACANTKGDVDKAQSDKCVSGRWIWVSFRPSAWAWRCPGLHRSPQPPKPSLPSSRCSKHQSFLLGFLAELMQDLLRGEARGREEKDGCRGGHGGRCVRSARSASAPSPLSEANTEKPHQRTGSGEGARGAAWGYRQDLCPFSAPPHHRKVLQGHTLDSVAQEWHSGACRRWLTSPFPSQFQGSHPQCIYCHCWQLLYFPVHYISFCVQGRESSAVGAAFKQVVRWVLFWDGATVQDLTFCVIYIRSAS